MKNLVLITYTFPFGKGEQFIETELPFLAGRFSKIIIIVQDVTSELTREVLPSVNVYRYNTSTSFKGFLVLPVLIISNLKTIVSMFIYEIKHRNLNSLNRSWKKQLYLLKKIIKAIQLKKYIKHILRSNRISEDIVFYSYWFKTGAHAISLLKYRNSIKISRAHRNDLYEDASDAGYLPLMNHCARYLDAVFFISEDGLNYFKSIVTHSRAQYIISRLGIRKSGKLPEKESGHDAFCIASCSYLAPHKRVDKIIEGLSRLDTEAEISWIHFGEGPLRSELEEIARKKLGHKSNIMFRFMGYYSNIDLMEYYSNNYIDLFVNTSSSEGIPVSLMEAQSFGIPVIAPDVGGIRELISEGTGKLIKHDFSAEDLAGEILSFLKLESYQTAELREKSYRNWEMNYNAELNYPGFIESINAIFVNRPVEISG